MADASIVTDAYRLGHAAVEVLAQTSPLNVQSGLSKVLHEGLSCAAMGPHSEKGKGIRWVSETNATEICMARRCSGRPQYSYRSWDYSVQLGIVPTTTANIAVVIP